MSENLLPCPFDNTTPITVSSDGYVACDKPSCPLWHQAIHKTTWNRRATPSTDVAGLAHWICTGLPHDCACESVFCEHTETLIAQQVQGIIESLSRERAVLAEGFKAAVEHIGSVLECGSPTREQDQTIRKALAMIGEGKEQEDGI